MSLLQGIERPLSFAFSLVFTMKIFFLHCGDQEKMCWNNFLFFIHVV